MQKGLNEKQLAKFKELYLQGYSASLIFRKLGFQKATNFQTVSQRMSYYRNKLNLPLRGMGFRSPFQCRPPLIDIIERKKRRVLKLERKISRWEIRLSSWKNDLIDSKKEIATLEEKKHGEA